VLLKATVVMDNMVSHVVKKPFRAEHGLAVLLETGGKRFLFDTGPSDLILHNLSLIGLHPRELDGIILSHGHSDHAGGLAAVLAHAGRQMPVYCHPEAFGPRYSLIKTPPRYAGMPFGREYLVSLGAEFVLCEQPLELAPGLWFAGPVPRTTDFETGDPNLVVPDEGCCAGCGCSGSAAGYRRDCFADDTAMFWRSEKGMVVFGGCAHSGIVNIIRHGLKLTGMSRLHGLLGGTHLGPASQAQIDATLAELAELEPDFVAANHCTGFAVMARLQEAFGPRFIPACVGTVIEC